MAGVVGKKRCTISSVATVCSVIASITLAAMRTNSLRRMHQREHIAPEEQELDCAERQERSERHGALRRHEAICLRRRGWLVAVDVQPNAADDRALQRTEADGEHQ